MWGKDFLLHALNLSLENSSDSYLCFWLALLHSVSYFFFLYHSALSLSTVWGAISSSLDEVLLKNPSANVFVFGDFKVCHKDWLIENYSVRTNRPDELCYQTHIKHNLTQMLTMLLGSLLFRIYLFLLILVFVLQWLSLHWQNHDHVV